MIDESLFANLKRSPFAGGDDVSSVFEQQTGVPSVPTSAIEDLGFTPEQLAFMRNGVYNGDFRTPPPEGDGVALDDQENKLSGWSYASSGSVTAAWEDDSSGGNVTFTVAADAGSVGDASITQVIPIVAIGRTRVCHIVTAQYTDPGTSNSFILSAQYLDADGVATGAADTEFLLDAAIDPSVQSVVPNGETGAPADAQFLQITVTAEDHDTVSATYVLHHVFVETRLAIPGDMVWDAVLSNKNDWGPFPRQQIVIVDDLGGSNREIRGIDSTGQRDGRIMWIYNSDSSNNLLLVHESGSATNANFRIRGPNGSDVTIRPHGGVMLMWFGAIDGATKRWRVLSQV